MKPAPVCNHDLPLPPRTTLANALHAYARMRKPLSWEPSRFAAVQGTVAPWLLRFDSRARELKQLARDQARDAVLTRQGEVPSDFARQLAAVLPIMADRRVIGHAVARKLKRAAPGATDSNARDLRELHEKLALCRVDGHAGVDEETGGQRFQFPFKCGSTRFCPDCAREHSAYESARYGEECLRHVQRGAAYRAHYAVFTRPSVPLGSMREGVEETLQMFRAWLTAQRTCSDVQRRRHGWSSRKRRIPIWQPCKPDPRKGVDYAGRRRAKGGEFVYCGPGGDGIHGALVQVECHLTAKGAWHPHLNVILLTRGPFSYKLARRLWGYNVEFRPVIPQAGDLARSFAELIKYPFRHVAEKSAAKAEAGETQAPPFDAWPDAAVVEWHGATRAEVECASGDTRIQGARWLRSYGVLHGIPPADAQPQDMRTLARLTFADDGTYHVGAFVGFIPGSKYFSSHQRPRFSDYQVPKIRPPPKPPP